MPSKKEVMLTNLVTMLERITTANGYDTNVSKVYADVIPMGLDLDEHELPAIFVIGVKDEMNQLNGCKYNEWLIELQLVHNYVSDALMHRFVRDVAKVLYNNNPSPGGKVNAWREIHPSVYQIEDVLVKEDLNLIEANRCFMYNWVIRYQTKPGDY